MISTPICDFVRDYAESCALRLHMPGHKGSGPLGMEQLDITEISGADSLYEAEGIIRQSERNASELFGCETFYSTEGSSQCIRAMLHLAALYAREQGGEPLVLAGRNAHKTFLSAVALLDLEVEWLWPEEGDSCLSCRVDGGTVERAIRSAARKPAAVYLTNPDYLGNLVDIRTIAKVCREQGVLLIVDNAHGAYLRFLPQSQHPIELGAHLCCDSAHKTLPVLTGGAYLHISPDAPEWFAHQAKNSMALFGSTSPSYLILQSLDAVNRTLAGEYREKLESFVRLSGMLKERLRDRGFELLGDEPLKLTLCTKSLGYTGIEYSERLQEKNIVCEFADPDFVVLMLAPETGEGGLEKLEQVLEEIPRRAPIEECPPTLSHPERVISVRDAVLSMSETVSAEDSVGRILASATVSCPPAVPIVVCGEWIDEDAVELFRYYGIKTCDVIQR